MRSLLLNRRFCFLVLTAAVFQIMLASRTVGADWSLSPSISVSETYDSNINFQYQDRQSDFITYIKPTFLLTRQTEQDQLKFYSQENGVLYIKNSQLNRIETYNNTGWTRQWSPRLSTDLGAGFNKTTAQTTQLEEAGIATALADQYIYNVRLNGTYALSEVLSLSTGGTAGQTWYPDKFFSGTTARFFDSNTALGNLNLAWKRSEVDTLGLNSVYSYTHYIDATTDNVQYFRPGVYWERTLSETASFMLGAGYRWTWISYFLNVPQIDPSGQLTFVKQSFNNTSSAFDFAATLRKSWTNRFSTSFAAGRDQYNDVNAVTTNHMYGAASMQYGLTELTTFNCQVRYDYNSRIGQGTYTTNYFVVSPSLQRKFTQDLSLRLAGTYAYQLQDVADFSQNADRYTAYLELVWQLPRLWANK